MIKKLIEKLFGICFHDFEEVEEGDYYRYASSNTIYYGKGLRRWRHLYAVKKVCLKCGYCVNEIDEWKKKFEMQMEDIKKRAEEKDNRKQLAKKMWEDCK